MRFRHLSEWFALSHLRYYRAPAPGGDRRENRKKKGNEIYKCTMRDCNPLQQNICSQIVAVCGRFGSRIFGLFPRWFNAILRRVFGMSKNALIWGANPNSMDIEKAVPETERTGRRADRHSSAQSPERVSRLGNRSI